MRNTRHLPIWRRLALRVFRAQVCWTDQADDLLHQPAIMTCNHGSLIDGILIALASPIPMAFAVTPTYAVHNRHTRAGLALLERCGLGRVVPLSDTHPIALRALCKALTGGESVMIFPSGTISPSPDKGGYLWLQKKTGAKIIRATIRGADKSRIFSRTGNNLWPKITITI